MKHPAQSSHHAQPHSWPAPLRGWIETDNPITAGPGGASVLENFIPTQTGVRMRGGAHTVSNAGAPVRSLITYDDGIRQKLFAVTASDIRDVSWFDGTPAETVVPGFSGGEPVSAQFTTLGGTYLYVVNGVDRPQLYDGTTWQEVTADSTPMAIKGVGEDRFSHVWAHQSRLFFVVANSMRIWVLPVGQVGGDVSPAPETMEPPIVDLSMSGVFTKGGRILFGASWSSDSGSGFGDRCIIVTDMGEIAVFEGRDPGDPNNWRKVGQYEISPPLGVNAHIKVGGDVLIATRIGLIPMSGVASKDPLLLETIAISRPIAKSWALEARATGTRWTIRRWDTTGAVLVMRGGARKECWGAHAETGAWFKIKGWDIECCAMHRGRLYFGGKDGFIRQAEATGRDDGEPIIGRYRGLLQLAPRPGLKRASLARATFATQGEMRFGLRFVTRDDQSWPTPPLPWSPISPPQDGWDISRWDQMRWDAGVEEPRIETTKWRSVSAIGHMIAPEVQVVSDGELPVICELMGIDAIVEGGGVVY